MEQAKRSPRFERKPKEESENRRTDKTLWRKYRSGAKPGFSTRLPGRGRAYFDRDLNRIHSEWQHKRAANLPNLLHQRGTRGPLLNSGHQRSWWKKKKRTKKKGKKGKEERLFSSRRKTAASKKTRGPRFSREETRIVSKRFLVLSLSPFQWTRKC